MRRIRETKADVEIKRCVAAKQCFSMVAGAGSGKTTSLVGALDYVRNSEGRHLRRDGKQVACITYTNRAVEVIASRLEWDALFAVSTLHSFLWGEIKRFTPNIREALRQHVIPLHIDNKRKDDKGGQSKTARAARDRIAGLTADLESLESVQGFTYSDTNYSHYAKGQLNHDDVIDIAAWLLMTNETLRRLIGQRYPYIFVDEAQDTFNNVVDALNTVCTGNGLPIVGYFGDPMQQIYDKRAGAFSGPPGAMTITKDENFRSAPEVIKLLNAFRKDVTQYAAGTNSDVVGSVAIALVRAEIPAGPRKTYTEEQLERAGERFVEVVEGWGWANKEDCKQLFLARQMIARRLGFAELQKLFTGQYASSRAQEEYENGSHFLVVPFVTALYPLFRAQRNADLRAVLDILRTSSPAFDPQGMNAAQPLRVMKERAQKVTQGLADMWNEKTLGEILKFSREHQLCRISERLAAHLDRAPRGEDYDSELHAEEKSDWLVDSFLRMSTKEIEAFAGFLNEHTALSTQHGVKGEEYRDVLVVFDDVEAAWNNYSFTKMLTPDTSGVPTEGQQERSRRLAYVCFSRAEENLRILLFTPNPESAKDELVSKGLFEEGQILIAG